MLSPAVPKLELNNLCKLYHRTLWVGRDLNDHLSLILLPHTGISLIRPTCSRSNPCSLSTIPGLESPQLLWKTRSTHMGKNFFLMFHLHPAPSSLKPLPLFLSLYAFVKGPFPAPWNSLQIISKLPDF